MPLSASTSIGAPVRSMKMAGETAWNGTPNVNWRPAESSAREIREGDEATASKGICICESPSEAYRIGKFSSPARAREIRPPMTLTTEPGAAAREVKSAALTSRIWRARCGARAANTPYPSSAT